MGQLRKYVIYSGTPVDWSDLCLVKYHIIKTHCSRRFTCRMKLVHHFVFSSTIMIT